MVNESIVRLRIPVELSEQIEEICQRDHMDVNQFLVAAVSERVSALKAASFF